MIKLTKVLALLATVFLVFGSFPGPGFGQSLELTSTTRMISFSELGVMEPVELNSPIQESEIVFSIPLDWVVETSVLTLDLEVSASSLLAPETSQALSGFDLGKFSIEFNGQSIFYQTVRQAGPLEMKITLPASQFLVQTSNQPHQLVFKWDALQSCNQNLISKMVILPASILEIGYSLQKHATSLSDFPAPFFQEKALEVQAVTLGLPPQPEKGELESALIIAAGLGRLSEGELEVHYKEIENPDTIDANTILIALRHRIWDGVAGEAGTQKPTAGQGQLQWVTLSGNDNSVLLVSGVDDVGIVRAAQALSRGQVAAPANARAVVIGSVEDPVSPSFQADMNFADLGFGDLTFTASSDKTILFTIPPGKTIGEEAYLDVHFSHSMQLDYLVSGLEITLNGVPLVSFRLSDSSSNSDQVRLILPTTMIRPGLNQLTFAAILSSRVFCSPTNSPELWLTVYSNSALHLPARGSTSVVQSPPNFGDLPSVLLTNPRMEDVGFVLPEDPGFSMTAAIQFAATLGEGLQGESPIEFTIFSNEDLATSAVDNYNLILIGRPSSFPGLSNSGYFPQLVFDEADAIAPQSQVGVVLVWQQGEPQGILALRRKEDGKTVLAILGNSQEGIDPFALKALMRPDLGEQNFAIVTASNISSSSIHFGQNNLDGSDPLAPSSVEVVDGATFTRSVAMWALPALLLSILLILLLFWSEVRKLFIKKR
ncbi:MAG: cellulose biosynthesis cyclic di-GMP-binding regulatory protein BcsB [Chloroflexi bacterium]|nr:cellulose biosynthesis cyclic di-GMP-binding regulatory protein BcsB [Chloroflexota bacterium]